MNRQQKLAWFNLVILVFSLLLSSTVVIWMAVVLKAGPIALSGFGLFAICLLHLLGPAVFPKKRKAGQVLFDERDAEIARRALSYGDVTSNVFFVSTFVCALLALGFEGSVRVASLGLIIGGAYFVSKVTESLTTLILYGRERTDGQD